MRYLLNVVYLLLILAVSPILFYRRWTQGKYRDGWSQKLWGNLPARTGDAPCLWFHAVSVGEVLQLEPIVASWKEKHPEWDIVISTTTNTGLQVAQDKFKDCLLCYCPLDFTWAVRRAFDRIRPSGFVLVELELWPNLIDEAHRRNIPAAIINGRLGEKSFRGYSRIRKLVRPLLQPFGCIAVQNDLYKKRFEALGANPACLHDVGSMKFDRLMTDRRAKTVCELRAAFQLEENSLVLMAGSTHAPEEQIVLETWKQLRSSFPELRLILAPRHAERFEEVANLVKQNGCQLLRRSEAGQQNTETTDTEPTKAGTRKADGKTVLLLDTLGELSACWGLADIAYVGGTLTNRGGQNMMEPAAYGCAVLFGPNTWNFADIVEELNSRKACLVVEDQHALLVGVRNLIENSGLRHEMGAAASGYVLSKRGASNKTVSQLERMLGLESEAISSRAA